MKKKKTGEGLFLVVVESGDREIRNVEGIVKLTALLNTLHGRVPNSLVHRLDGIFDGGAGILLRIRARRKADALGGSQGGARRAGGNGAKERHVFCRVLEVVKLSLFGELGGCELGSCFGR